MLEALDRANLFLVPLDDHRHWYRYHHLFAEVLRARLIEEQPDEVPELHRRASAWHEQHGELDSAIQHALAASDYALAARLIEAGHAGDGAGSPGGDAARLDGGAPRRRSSAHAPSSVWALPAPCCPLEKWRVWRLDCATQSDGRMPSDGGGPDPDQLVVVDADEFRRLPGTIAIYRSGQALARGDATATVAYARRALDLLDEDDQYRRGAAAALEGLALWGSGDLEGAYEGYAESVASFRRSGHIADVLGCTVTLADIRLTQGRLGDAMTSYETALQLALEQTPQVRRGIPDMHVGMSTILYERGDLEAATAHLELGAARGRRRRIAEVPIPLETGHGPAATSPGRPGRRGRTPG